MFFNPKNGRFGIISLNKEWCIPTVASVNEAKAKFSGILSNVEGDLVPVTTIPKNSQLAFKISDEDLFSDDSGMWETCN